MRDAPLPTVAHARVDSKVRVLLVEELPQVVERVRDLLKGHPDLVLVETVGAGTAALDRITAMQPDVLVLDALLQGSPSGLQVVRMIREYGASLPIILLTVPDRPIKVTPQIGIAEVVMLPDLADALVPSIVRTDDAHRGPAPVPPTGSFVVYSAKGGSGATTIARDLAVAFSQTPGTRVALVDGDVHHGDLRLALGAPHDAPSFLDLPTGHVTAEDLRPVLWRDQSGVDVLLAPARLEQADLVTKRDVETAVALLRRLHDVVVIDVPTAMSETTLTLFDSADAVVDVVTPDRVALLKARRCRSALAAAAYPMHDFVSVLNRAEPSSADSEAVAGILGYRPASVLPDEPRLVGGGLADGRSLVDVDPEAAYSRGIAGLARLLVERVAATTAQSVRAA